MKLSRRTLLCLLGLGGAGATVGLWSFRRRAPRSSDNASPLSTDEKQRLWEFCEATGALLALPAIAREDFVSVVDAKTQPPTIYLTEYRNALELFNEARRDRSAPEAVKRLIDPNDHSIDLERRERARRLVLLEFIRLYLARGGFRRFGLSRWPGFAGGDYRVAQRPPGGRR
ncbi:MAG TPA: hypothetical protein VFF06_26005 [Polyangia bacterium]|nr:hypothetical protein [Polyangia bacterium]